MGYAWKVLSAHIVGRSVVRVPELRNMVYDAVASFYSFNRINIPPRSTILDQLKQFARKCISSSWPQQMTVDIYMLTLLADVATCNAMQYTATVLVHTNEWRGWHNIWIAPFLCIPYVVHQKGAVLPVSSELDDNNLIQFINLHQCLHYREIQFLQTTEFAAHNL